VNTPKKFKGSYAGFDTPDHTFHDPDADKKTNEYNETKDLLICYKEFINKNLVKNNISVE